MKKYLSLLVVLAVAITLSAGSAIAQDSGTSNTRARIMCTMDAKMCPDGSFVGRTGPNCEFTACPNFSGPPDLKPLPIPMLKDNSEAMREVARQKLVDLRNKINDEKDAVKAEIKRARITGRENALKRFDAAVARINDLKDRVNEQIIKFEARGVDVASAKNFVATTETKLIDAKAKIAEINAVLSVSINELSADNKAKLVSLAQETQGLIRQAHQALMDAIKSLKDEIKIKVDSGENSGAVTN